MSNHSFQNEVPKARINIKLDLHTGGALKKVELPLKLMILGDFSNGREQRPVSERSKVDINRHNLDAVLGQYRPQLNLSVPDTLAGDGSHTAVALSFERMGAFSPEQVAGQIPQLRRLLAMRNLLRDLKSNLLDDASLRRELERVLQDPARSDALRLEIAAISH